MLKILDKNKVPLKGLRVYSDLCIESVLDLDDRTLSFSAPLRNVRGYVVPEGYIETKEDRFVVKEVSKSTDGKAKIVAALDMEALEGKSFRSSKRQNRPSKPRFVLPLQEPDGPLQRVPSAENEQSP